MLDDNSAAPSERGLSPAAAVFLGTVRQLSPTDSNFTQFPAGFDFCLLGLTVCRRTSCQHGECCTPVPLSPCWSTAAGEVTSATGWKQLWAMLRWPWNTSLGGCGSKGLVTWLQWMCLKTGRTVCKVLMHRAGFILGCACSWGPVGGSCGPNARWEELEIFLPFCKNRFLTIVLGGSHQQRLIQAANV